MQNKQMNIINAKNNLFTLIKEMDIKIHTAISSNIVETSLIPYIVQAEHFYIKKNLGKVLYKKLVAEYTKANFDKNLLPTGDGLIPPIITGDTINYLDLYDEIYYPLVFWSYAFALPNIAYKVEESGIMLGDTDYSESVGAIGLEKLEADAKAKARSRTQELIEYVCETFNNEDDDVTIVGKPSFQIYTANKPWQKNKNNCCDF